MAAEKKCLFLIFSSAFFTILFILTANSGVNSAAFPSKTFPPVVRHGPSSPPAFAYYISGGPGHKDRIIRLLLAVYHPRNRYLLHLSHEASDGERVALASAVRAVPAVQVVGNVDVIGKADATTYMGSSTLAAVLHAASILMRLDSGWDWFITLSSTDYPLVTQDDLSHVFSSVPRDLNFIDHTSDLGWKELHRMQPIVVDPGIYLGRKTNKIFHATQTRPTPAAFKVFTGSPWVTLSRSFIEFCLMGWDNLPRVLLLYFTNVMLSEEGYFHSVICNSPEFQNLTVNSDLRYIVWDNPPKMEPHFLNVTDYDNVVHSGVAFARQFKKNDPVLDIIDEKILQRGSHQAAPGAWCSGRRSWWMDPCTGFGDVNVVKPGPQASNLEDTMTKLLEDWKSQSSSCK
ncbi:beta-glucuronosyltransferase GlcAT14A-like [Aristolochia californica]|uniref:beta-glucuronosyltransferase GlcAT14A-like n=1 Tax=Aristolochia californica TaxID=171875 RepID=UPI0035D95649